ncbi:UDP-N-acetylmuramyl pentapeptide phosphotransferase [Microbacterium capsulatum]|uniref:UDP-N-acetylmuramyl pentapeptide phosphotransferase n=1 Tax=Microbacterium capsulatum TaxID=3041921 RepID=A0ABU0XFQ9_9MICO|nr:UDP-N-acetylmuramyl pentapeptide phosphotransferase [Microbacterium sp. ASV81]MDQ4213955.1 UDP-N-acetylmuramyl pentapeptide phosphotransferase [Microbacterium sp. ASV81]
MASENIYRQETITDTGSVKIVEMDAARRPDVLFRVRRDESHEISAWWMIGAFVLFSGIVVALLSGVPGSA